MSATEVGGGGEKGFDAAVSCTTCQEAGEGQCEQAVAAL